jgi:pyruvate kinase
MTRSKIIATIGPASSAKQELYSLINAGVDLFRLNMSHGALDEKRELIRTIRRMPEERGTQPVGILGDLCGPKIRVGRFSGGSVELVTGGQVVLTTQEVEGTPERFQVDYAALGKGIKKGFRILIDDGMIVLRAISAQPGEVVCKVAKGGILKERKGVNFPGLPLELPSITDKDRADLQMLLEEDVDYIALSFVREPGDVIALKDIIRRSGKDTPVVAKIERPEAIKNIKDIIRVSDGIMVARGDLGVEMPPELVPPLQKKIIKLCHEMKKPVITATQMLESMIRNPIPTRAEASDVAGAVFDGTDALMLSGETAMGDYPEASVKMMDRIAREAERNATGKYYDSGQITTDYEAISNSACRMAEDLKVKAVISFTRTGSTALLISKYRPNAMVIAATPDERVLTRMRLYYGVMPVMMKLQNDTDAMIREVERAAVLRGLVKNGDRVIVTLGVPSNARTNLLKVHRVGEVFAG